MSAQCHSDRGLATRHARSCGHHVERYAAYCVGARSSVLEARTVQYVSTRMHNDVYVDVIACVNSTVCSCRRHTSWMTDRTQLYDTSGRPHDTEEEVGRAVSTAAL